MNRELLKSFTQWLGDGPRTVGQVRISRAAENWELRHVDDSGDLTTHTRWQDARALANLTDEGAFRPIKTTRDLRRGWRLMLASIEDVVRALDYFYPAMLGLWNADMRGELVVTDLRETLARQTGMYRVTQKITDAQAQQLCASHCSLCMKTMLWKIDSTQPITSLVDEKHERATGYSLPLLCREACNFLIGHARGVVKKAEKEAQEAASSQASS
jgi:sirohydrochlorin cobaltochelatase